MFGQGDGHLGKEVLEEVVRRNMARSEKAADDADKLKKALCKLQREYRAIRGEMKKKSFKFVVKNLKVLVKYKKRDGDKALPTKKEALLARWEETKDRASPNVSPSNSEIEDEDMINGDGDSDVEEEFMGDESETEDETSGGLVFDSDSDEE